MGRDDLDTGDSMDVSGDEIPGPVLVCAGYMAMAPAGECGVKGGTPDERVGCVATLYA